MSSKTSTGYSSLKEPAPRRRVSAEYARSCATVALTLTHSAPTPGTGSRYSDVFASLESRILLGNACGDAVALSDRLGVGEVLLAASEGARNVGVQPDPRMVAYLAPVARAGVIGVPLVRLLRGLGNAEVEPFARAFREAGVQNPLTQSLGIALSADSAAEITLREIMRFSAAKDGLSRDYVAGYEVPRELGAATILSSLSRYDSARAAIVQSYLEVLAEVPDPDIAARAGMREAEDVSRMARGVLKAGGAHARRGLQGIANLDGILREDPRISPTATEPVVAAAAFIVCLEHGPDALGSRVRPATPTR